MSALKIAPDGRFCGYASHFGNFDQSGDRIEKGAFENSLVRRGIGSIKMLFQHDPREVIGVWDIIKEDNYGLYVEGRLSSQVGRAEELKQLINFGALDGLSIGFRTLNAKKMGRKKRSISLIDLWEISIVTFPMMARAHIRAKPHKTKHNSALAQSLSDLAHCFEN